MTLFWPSPGPLQPQMEQDLFGFGTDMIVVAPAGFSVVVEKCNNSVLNGNLH